MGMILGLCAAMVLLTYAPDVMTKATALFKAGVRKLLSLWKP